MQESSIQGCRSHQSKGAGIVKRQRSKAWFVCLCVCVCVTHPSQVLDFLHIGLPLALQLLRKRRGQPPEKKAQAVSDSNRDRKTCNASPSLRTRQALLERQRGEWTLVDGETEK
eukprot:8702641-Pyramimonas_sp.AAC.1